MNDSPSENLNGALERAEIALPAPQIAQLESYCRLLWEHNQKLNLTRHTDFDTFVQRDVVDTLRISELIGENASVLDVGSGGGVPGITLSIVRPDLDVTLSESVGKKAAALESMARNLELECSVFSERAENLLGDLPFDVLTARAVGPLWKLCRWFEDKWHLFGCLLAIKGPKWVEERGEARHRGVMGNVELRKVAEYPMPGTKSNSVVLRLARKRLEDV